MNIDTRIKPPSGGEGGDRRVTKPLILPQVGHTPLFLIKSLSTPKVSVWAKAEWQQPGGSVKARAARMIIKRAISCGSLHPGVSLLDASSGNTAIAYATLLQPLGWKPTICLPSNASSARIKLLQSLGANLILTSPLEGTDGAQVVARELHEQYPHRYYYADQYSNDANWLAHYHTTALEIWSQTHQAVTHFVAGLGTTGTFTGTGRRLKELGDVKLVALQPDQPLHPLEGWKDLETARIPKIYDRTLADEVKAISTDETYAIIKFIARHEGLYLSPSSAANLQGAIQVAGEIEEGMIVTTLADTLDRYPEVKKEIFNT
ncbi:MAG TPA: cysteine synthase family protein [Saprospiraceae bacterium]|nr:cysteine synthase family protein [Saprospiraceae bacterium]